MEESLKKFKDSGARPINRVVAQLFGGFVFAAVFLNVNGIAFSLAPVDEIKYHDGSRRDPFEALVGPDGLIARKARRSDLTVEGIITDHSGSSLAVIDGELYKAGDRIGETLIIQVFEDRVVLAQEDEEKIVWLREELRDRKR